MDTRKTYKEMLLLLLIGIMFIEHLLKYQALC